MLNNRKSLIVKNIKLSYETRLVAIKLKGVKNRVGGNANLRLQSKDKCFPSRIVQSRLTVK